jgi:hypothetical protein
VTPKSKDFGEFDRKFQVRDEFFFTHLNYSPFAAWCPYMATFYPTSLSLFGLHFLFHHSGSRQRSSPFPSPLRFISHSPLSSSSSFIHTLSFSSPTSLPTSLSFSLLLSLSGALGAPADRPPGGHHAAQKDHIPLRSHTQTPRIRAGSAAHREQGPPRDIRGKVSTKDRL